MSFIDRFLKSPAERPEPVRIPAWDTPDEPERKIVIGEIGARDRLWWHRTFWELDVDEDGDPRQDDRGREIYRTRDFWSLALVMLCLRDATTDERLFSKDDVLTALDAPAALFDKYFMPLTEFYAQAAELNGMAAGATEEAANFTPATASSEGSSTSPETGASPSTTCSTECLAVS